uniref:Transposase for insertion sequence element IS21-like C-terminal domain-containing protein n=1 Tax=Candidatus Kentrum sp. LPFa TaxID=2126335 RepID=A0A450X6U1_9GAMM|nr:MAG: hypothetical protein BECKLPF1236A_GA0070988_104463 [Candidatus Kentron sp. LPFa]
MAVQVVERWILARLRHRRFFSLVELNTAIRQLRGQMNDRPLQRHKVSRRELFETLDKPVLRPLPPTPYEYAQWKKAKVGIDYHIEFDGRLYSVPHNLVGQAVELRISATVISVLHKGKQVSRPASINAKAPGASTPFTSLHSLTCLLGFRLEVIVHFRAADYALLGRACRCRGSLTVGSIARLAGFFSPQHKPGWIDVSDTHVGARSSPQRATH